MQINMKGWCIYVLIPLLLKDDVHSNFTSAQQTLIFALAGYNFLLFFIILVTVHSFCSVEIHLILFHEF